MVKVLKTRDTVLNKEQIKENLAKIASSNQISKKSSSITYPIPRVKDNLKYILLVYNLLSEHVKLNIPIHPAGEWILDNYYIIEKSAKTVSKELSKNKYIKFPGLANNGFARIFVLANEIVSNTDGKIKKNELIEFLEAYQTQKKLNMEEIWNLGIFIQISIIEKIRNNCEKIFIAQIQKQKAINIVERLIENRPKKRIKIETHGEYPFIEFMSYKLKKYGNIGTPYLDALDETVKRSGMSVKDVINREHFDIAIRTLAMKNCITSIKEINRIDIIEIFEKINEVEKLLKQDPAHVYEKMDYKTKSYYRTKILELSNKTKLSEIFIVEQVLDLCNDNNIEENKKMHVGYYLIDEGKKELLTKLLSKKIHVVSYDEKAKQYIFFIYFFTILITLALTKIINLWAFLLFIPIQNAVTQIAQYLLNKIKKNRLIPKLDLRDGIPEELATMCIIPTILTSEKDVEKIVNNMEIYYLANKSENLYFTLLGDCTSESKESEEHDKKIIETGIQLTEELNKKYGKIFFFVYRKREWVHGEKCFMGWERKRGLINQYNEFLKTGKSDFLVNTCNTPLKIKYIITLDSDTELTLNSASQLVGAMGHILNKPEVNKIKNIVEKGHAIIQPRVGINIDDGRKSTFSRLFAGNGGTDLYSNAISDVYQDSFDEGIFTGKGIYDLDVFYEVLKDAIPENTVLSHDLLEGSFLRCGLASDIVLMDGYPSKYTSFKLRKHRWIRGDIQILKWLKSRLNLLSKYKIIDNIVRNKNEEYVIISLVALTLFYHKFLFIPLLIYSVPTIIRLIDNLINQRDGTIKHKLFVSSFSKWTHTLYKFFTELAIMPDIALLEIDAFCKAIYRMKISHCKLLEWTTADEAEKQLENSYISYFKGMLGESIFAVIAGTFVLLNTQLFSAFNIALLISLLVLWLFSSVLMWSLSQKNKDSLKISQEDEKYLLRIAEKTWTFFKENLVNFLPIDNLQEGRSEKKALRTSPTNIGLALLSVISSYDLGFENLDDTIQLLKGMLETIDGLQKWNGHLYNWYDIENLKPILPNDISSVDSGNFVGYLYTTKQFLEEHKEIEECNELILKIERIIQETDFRKLYNEENGLFSIGFNIQNNNLYDSYYDLLASEARQTSLIAIAKKDVPAKHWSNLGRTLTRLREHKGLVSWGGTAFEYLMPNINIPTYPSTLLEESCKLLILSDKEYAEKMDIPWGMSEAAFSVKDFKGNYQYKTFGIPWLGLKRGLEDEVVVSPYSSALALTLEPKDAIHNLRKLEKDGVVGEYGFYDSIDYKPKKEIVKTYMAHHQGMILTSIDNVLNANIFQKRFMKNPEMQGVKILLEENMPEDVIITKEKKNKAKKIKYEEEKTIPRTSGVNLISRNELSNIVDDKAEGYTKLDDIVINKAERLYLKNMNSNKLYDFNNMVKDEDDQDKILFTPHSSKLKVEDGNIKAIEEITIAANSQVEIRKITLLNKGINETEIELTTYKEPILSTIKAHNAHPTFNKMFLNYEKEGNNLIISRKSRSRFERTLYLATTLYSNEGMIEFEINKEKFISRENRAFPEVVENSKPLTCNIENVTDPIVAFRKTVKIKPEEEKIVYLISSVDYEKDKAISELNKYCNDEQLSRVFELSKEQTEAEIRYMGISEKDVIVYNKMIEFLECTKQEAFDRQYKNSIKELDLSNKRLWRFGISGDYPLIVLKLKEHNEMDILQEIYKAYEYFVSKGVRVELVILASKEIKKEITEGKIEKYLNQKGGIFVLDELKYDDIKMIEARSNILLNAQKGTLEIQINELDKKEKSQDKEKNIEYIHSNNKAGEKELIKTKYKELNYENEYGAFNEKENEYWIQVQKNHKTPVAWSNIMANKNFGTVITESIGGFTWYINSQTNRITKFSNDSYIDPSPEKIVVKNYELTEDEYYVGYGMGYTHFAKEQKELKQNLTIFVPIENSLKISILRIQNKGSVAKNLDIKYDVDLLMGESKDESIVVENYKKNLNMIVAKNLMKNHYITYITSNEKIDENKEIHLKLMPAEEREIVFIIGTQNTEMECIEVATKYLSTYISEYEKTKQYWKDRVSRVTSKTPLKSFDIMQNGYLVYQTIVSRMYGRTGFYQSSGGYGFRDQLQDSMGMKWVDPEILKNQILFHAKHQFTEGDVEHWWHEDSGLGIRTRYSDDLLWLVYAVEEYIDFTGDYSILDEKINYLKAEVLKPEEQDRVDYYKNYDKEDSIFNHCCKSIIYASKLGNHNLPLIKHGDWNDGMNKIGEKEKGESVWLGFFLYDIINRFEEIIKFQEKNNKPSIISKDIEVEINEAGNTTMQPTEIQDCQPNDFTELKNNLEEIKLKIKNALNTVAWDGRWFIRAFDDNGNKIGSNDNEECKIDSIAQSFSVISGAGDNDKKYIAMSSLENYLVDEENNLVKLLTPPLEKNNLGYISSYAKGMRENGGQYTHECCC